MKWLESGDLLVNDETEPRVVFRQVGWVGQTGAFYNMDCHPWVEPGGLSPVYVQILPE